MLKTELIAMLEEPVESQMVSKLTHIIKTNDLDGRDLLEISFHKKKEIAFRAAWMLEYMATHERLWFYELTLEFLKLFPKQKNPSAMRHYAKIVSILTDRKSSLLYKEVLSRAKLDPLIETLFTWLIDEQVLVATKVHCMQALANLVSERAWIKDELLDTIDHLVGVESIAFFARAKMVKKTLKKHNDDL